MRTVSNNYNTHPPLALTSDTSERYNISRDSPHLENRIAERLGERQVRMSRYSETPLGEYVAWWVENVKKRRLKAGSLMRLQQSARTLLEYPISQLPLQDISFEDVQEYINQLTDRGYGYTTIKKYKEIVSAPLKYAYNRRTIDRNPADGVEMPRKRECAKPAREIKAYTPEEQAAMREMFHHRCCDAYWALEIMLETGMRVGELLALQWEDVFLDVEHPYIYVHRTMVNATQRDKAYIQDDAKSESSNRKIPLSACAKECFDGMLFKNGMMPYIFEDKKGLSLSYQGLQYQYRHVCKCADIPIYSLHALRHTFATNQFNKGTKVTTLAKLLGHASASVTMNTYVHLYGDGFNEMVLAVS